MMQLSQLRFLTQILSRYYGISLHDFIAFFCITINHNFYWITPNVKQDMCLERVFECHFYRIVYICYFIETTFLFCKSYYSYLCLQNINTRWKTFIFFTVRIRMDPTHVHTGKSNFLSKKPLFISRDLLLSKVMNWFRNVEYSFKGSENARK